MFVHSLGHVIKSETLLNILLRIIQTNKRLPDYGSMDVDMDILVSFLTLIWKGVCVCGGGGNILPTLLVLP